MKREKVLWLFRSLLLMIMLTMVMCLPAGAEGGAAEWDELYQEQAEASGAGDLPDNLPEETRQLLDQLGITSIDAEGFSSLEPQGVWKALAELTGQEASGPLRSVGVVLGVVLLCALMEGMKQTLRDPSASPVFQVVCVLAACAALLVPLSSCVQAVCRAAESTSVFMGSFVPVYAGILVTAGHAVTAASYQTVVLFAAELITLLATHLLVPLLTVSLALGMAGSLDTGLRLDSLSSAINKGAAWLLGLTTTLFVGLLTLQGIVGGAADTLSSRALRFSLSSMVPVVGGSLSEAFSAVKGCLGLLKSTVGGFGMLATALIVLPPLLQCAVWSLGLALCTAAAELFGLGQTSALLRSAQAVVKTLIAVLAACSLFMIVTTAVVTAAGGAAV